PPHTGSLRRRHDRPARRADVPPPGQVRQYADHRGREKEQVEILADRITELLDMVMIKDPAARVPQTALDDRIDNAGLNVPIEPEFRVGTMSLGWDTVKHELVIECFE